MDKEEFWQKMKEPAKKGCWNCIHDTSKPGCEFLRNNTCNGFMDVDVYDSWEGYYGKMKHPNPTKKPHWLRHWEWNGNG